MKTNSKLEKSFVSPPQLPGIHKMPVIAAGEDSSNFSLNKSKFPFLFRLLKTYLGKPIMKIVRKISPFHDMTLTLLFYTLTIWSIKELYNYFTLIKAILIK